ncbi:MAG TPA: DUF6159 family protein [Candidatus Thermoplasmatota archaeon]|nr:DUF6159 family protein [Candidatus Thermoplasmatota archaeon]
MTKTSFKVLKLDKEILALPLMSAVLMVIAVVGLGFGAFGIGTDGGLLFYAALFAIYVVVYAIAIFFNAAVIEMATIRFNGGDPVLKDGLKKSWSKLGRIIQWAFVAATVGLIFRILRDQAKNNFLAHLVLGLMEGAWNIVTYFAVPIAVYRDVGPMQAIKGSTGLVKRTFGESLTGIVTTGLVFFLLGLLGLIPFFLGILMGGAFGLVLMALAVVYWIALSATNVAIDGILVAALYKYANEGVLPQAFRDQGVQAADVAW